MQNKWLLLSVKMSVPTISHGLPSVKVQILWYLYDVWLVYVVLCLFLDNSDSPYYSGAVITEGRCSLFTSLL